MLNKNFADIAATCVVAAAASRVVEYTVKEIPLDSDITLVLQMTPGGYTVRNMALVAKDGSVQRTFDQTELQDLASALGYQLETPTGPQLFKMDRAEVIAASDAQAAGDMVVQAA